MNAIRWIYVTLAVAALASGCAHSKIPRTNIDDTEDNRMLLGLVEEYQRALENLDADAVLSLVSERYFEDNGNTDASDDYDRTGLEENLRAEFKRTRALKLELRIDAIEVEENEAFVELYYRIRAHNEYPSGLKWETGSDRTRLTFAREDRAWRIVAGL